MGSTSTCTTSEEGSLPRYFGYGSNLNVADFARWARDNGYGLAELRPVGRAYLPDHALAFHYFSGSREGGALDIVAHPGAVVPGGLFDVDDSSLEALDEKEGAGSRYERCEVEVLTEDGGGASAISYRVQPDHVQARLVEPTDEYLEIVRRGLRGLGLPMAPAEAAARGEVAPPWPRSVFVYGTLMTGECREGAMRHIEPDSVAAARCAGTLYDLGSYPALTPTGEGQVRGELWRYDELGDLLERLDAIEGFKGFGVSGSLYRRVLVRVSCGGSAALAWTYVYGESEPAAPVIASGSWRERG